MQSSFALAVSSTLAGVLAAGSYSAQCGVQTLVGEELPSPGSFGDAVALADGVALVGDGKYESATGAAYVFKRVGGVWSLDTKLLSPDGATYEYFGRALALDGGTAVVGASADDDPGSAAGAVYVFADGPTGWQLVTKLEAGDEEASAYFGTAVALDGARLVVGAPYKDEPGGADAGAAYVFELDPVLGWVETAKLVASDGTATDYLGEAVALSGDTIALGARTNNTTVTNGGTVYVFEKGPTGWVETFRVEGDVEYGAIGEEVALDGDLLAWTALGAGVAGQAYLAERVGGVWAATETLAPPDGGSSDLFGCALSLDGDRLAVGARKNGSGIGAAYLYERGPGGWTQAGKLSDPDASDFYGGALALHADDLLVGDQSGPGATAGAGAAFAYRLDAGAELFAAPAELALDAGGVQVLELTTCPPAIGATAFVLGSLGGTTPGITLAGGLVLPLNPDPYLTHTLLHPNQAPLLGSLQVLDLTGAATATFTLPTGGFPSLTGLTAHHAFVVFEAGGALLDVSNAAPLAFVPTKSVWSVDDDGPADFDDVGAALASPAVKDGDTLLVHPGGYAGFTVQKEIQLLAAAGQTFGAGEVVVSGAPAFAIAGLRTSSLRIENVPGRGVLEDCLVGGLAFDGYGGSYWRGETQIENCDQLLIARGTFHGDDACYPETDVAWHAIQVRSSRVVFADCTVYGGNGAGEGCPTHYPTAGYGIEATAGSDLTLAGTTVIGGEGPGVSLSAVWAEASTVRVRGASSDALTATAPAAALDGPPGGLGVTATVSGVTVSGAPLPPWVVQPAVAEPFVRLAGFDGLPPAGAIHVHGPAGGAALIAVALQPALGPPPSLVPDLVWFDLGSVLALLPTATLGQDTPAVSALPALPLLAGTTAIVQAWMPLSPGGLPYLTNPTSAVVRWQ